MTNETPPIVESFQIFGLHGYKDVTIDFPNATKIVIAENGSGKTTILTALDAFLRTDYSKLHTIAFESLVCKFSSEDEPITLKREDISSLAKSHSGETMKRLVGFTDHSAADIYAFVTNIYRPDEGNSWRRSDVAHDIYLSSPYDWDEIKQYFDNIKEEIESAYSDEIKSITQKVSKNLSAYDLLYLPTYRRVEKPLAIDSSRRRHMAASRRSGRHRKISDSDIRYGLDDVQNMLIDISQEIQQRTNNGYRKISKEIIDDLLAGGLEAHALSLQSLPTLDVLKRFFSRVGEFSDNHLARIEELYKNDGNTQDGSEKSQLIYFLSKLATVVSETYQLESTIERFVEISNAYLTSTSDSKSLLYDPVLMSVSVKDSWTGGNVELNDLSSGEKQVVSLLAHLYLDQRTKIVLIDEPELSLSIEWQKRILLDIANSPQCAQLLAITHSPFVFDNELDDLAASLNVARRRIFDE